MWGRGVLLVSFALIAFGTAKCPKRKTSPFREILCYTSTLDAQLLAGSVCSCTTLVHQNHDVRNVSISDISDLRKSLKEMHPSLQFVISIHDPVMTLRNSAMVRQEAIARIVAVMKEVDGVEMNVTAGSKERLYNFIKSLKDEMIRKSYDKRLFIALPNRSEDLAKHFDIKELIKYIDLFTLPTDYMTDEDGVFVTFHPSRLMGLFDMLNTDSLVDLISGLGAPKQKILMTLPASAYKFTLKNEDENAPRSETTEKEPVPIDRKQLCEAINTGEWTVERDEDLTAPYAFQNKTWIAFEDKISVGIKGKYALLRDLAGLAVRNIENDMETECEEPLVQEIYRSFTEFRRKSRQAVLNALEDELHQMQFSYPNHAKTSSFRVVRKVDSQGHIRAVRESTQTEFVCRRQGYFVHPKSCNRFYRCVKFNQAVEDYSVFEFDCPAGLSFDERTEVCVWPGSLPEGSPCPGSSEIAPVAPRRFECTQSGYYADPQNCRWFFACMDLGESELMAFEFRCPYGLVFDEKKLVCEWPWLVPACSQSGSGYTRTEYNYGGYGGASTGVGVGGYVTGNLPEYSVTDRTDYSNVDYSRITSIHDIHGTSYFGSTAGNIGTYPDISTSGVGTVSGHVGLSSPADYSKGTVYGGAIPSVPTYSDIQIDSIRSKPIIVGGGGTGYSTPRGNIGGIGYTSQDDTGYSISGGFDAGFANTRPLGGVTAGFSGSTAREYSETASGSHSTKQGATYSERPSSGYPNSVAGSYIGGVTNPITDASYSRRPGSYFGSTELPKSSSDVYIDSTSPKYVGSTNVYSSSSTLNDYGYLGSTDVYSGATGRQPPFGETGPSFVTVSYPSAIGKVGITGSTNGEYTGSTAKVYGESTGTEYSKTGGFSGGSTKNKINLSVTSGTGSSAYSTTSSGRFPGTDFIGGPSKSGISAVSDHVSSTPGTTDVSSTGYRYNNEEGYTIPVVIQHEPSFYPSTGTTGVGTTRTSEFGLGSYGKTDFTRPKLNISIVGNEIPTGYDIQKDITGAIQTGGSVGGSITTSDSFSGTVFSHGNTPGTVSVPVINQGNVLAGEVQPGYITTSPGISGYGISDGVKNIDIGSVRPGTLIYGTPSPAISVSGPSTAGVLLKGDSTPGTISGQIAPGVAIGGSIQSSLPHKSYGSTYPSIDGAFTRGSTIYSSSTSSEGLIPTAPHGYRTDEERGTLTFNASYDTSKYRDNDIPDYRPTNAILPDFSGIRVESPGDGIHGSTFEGLTTPRYSSSKSPIFTPSGFTKTGPTRTGITTAILGGGGSYSVSTSDRRPAYNPDNIGEKAFEGNVAGYTKTSPDGLSGYSSTALPGNRFTIQSTSSGYLYPKPAVQFGTSGATFSSTPIVPIDNNVPASKPFFSRLPTSTIRPVIYTTEHPEIYKASLFESSKIPVSTVRPVIDTGYKTVITSTAIPVSVLTYDRTGSSQTASVTASNIGLGVPFQQTDLSGQTGHSVSSEYLPAKSTEASIIASTTKYDKFTVTGQPQLGVTYKKPSVSVTYGGPSSFQTPTTYRPSNVYYSGQGFSTTPSSLGTSSGSPTNLDISRDKINNLITNYDRGTIKHTPTTYDTTRFGSTSSFSAKTGSGFAITTPSGVRPSTFSYEVTTKSPENKGKVIVKWSDLHPLLLGKLGAECTCKADPFANLRGPEKNLIDSSKGKVDLANYDSSEIYVDLGSSQEDYSTNAGNLPAQPFKISAPITTSNLPSSSYLPVADTRTSARSNEFRTGRRMGKKLEYEEEEEKEEEEEEQEKDQYDQYNDNDNDDDPDQIINGVTDCARPGLFRHPSLCNKFYACHWDQWKKKFTLHIFNCPIHLTFDSNAGACNWPSKGPACQDNNLLV
ncbi:mucin-19 [Monomorium pharaonis]|uniref:mucin-19 n=1 Tax=Monomorium pharaonis TaxID=307658 RepID=UPI00063F3EB9|nr:mucin-19 [Monomorium pharaonis]